jgi:hypothetical protein
MKIVLFFSICILFQTYAFSQIGMSSEKLMESTPQDEKNGNKNVKPPIVPPPVFKAKEVKNTSEDSETAQKSRRILLERGFVICTNNPKFGDIYVNTDKTLARYIDQKEGILDLTKEQAGTCLASAIPLPTSNDLPVLRKSLPNIQSIDITGTWQSADGWKAEWFQTGNNAYAILNVSNFKHFVSATVTGNQIRGQIVRYDLNSNCKTIMEGIWTINGNTMQVSWRDLDGKCDLQLDQTGIDAPLTRVSRPVESPMNGFGGAQFDPNTDVTGSWGESSSGNSYGDWMQDNENVYFIANGNGFKQFFQGTRSGNQIIGTHTRYNPSGCLTIMSITYTQINSNTMQYIWRDNDGNCDLTLGQIGSGTIVKSGK